MINADNTCSIYVFALPIQYKTANEYKNINNDIADSFNEKYRFQNVENEIKTFSPKYMRKEEVYNV